MNLNKKQLSVLVDEIYLEILPKQKEQLLSIKDGLREKIKKEIQEKYPIVVEALKVIDFDNIQSIRLSRKMMSQIVGKDVRESSIQKIEDIVDICYSSRLKQEFTNTFGEEITREKIEKLLILETIGATNIDELIAGVKKRLEK